MIVVANLYNLKKCNNCIDIMICRPSILGNPFHINKDRNRREVIKSYIVYLKQQIVKRTNVYKELRRIQMLEEKNPDKIIRLLCYCKPLPCHGDVIKYKLENRMFF